MNILLKKTTSYIGLLAIGTSIRENHLKFLQLFCIVLNSELAQEFELLRQLANTLKKNRPELVNILMMKRKFIRRSFNVGGNLPVPSHYNY